MATVLVVDDQPDLVEVLVKLLRRCGHDVYGVEDGRAAVAFARTFKIDLMILDLMIPKVNGFEVLEALAKNPGLDQISVVMYSATSDLASRRHALKLGASEVVAKSRVDPTGICEVVGRYGGVSVTSRQE